MGPSTIPPCAWWEDDPGWSTECGRSFDFFDHEGPRVNLFRFCPFCGLPIVEYIDDDNIDEIDEEE